jgi:photosystem II stability/assembly factor-like uncharacterized protein
VLGGCDGTGTNGDEAPSAVAPSANEPGTWTLVRAATETTIQDVAVTEEGAYAVAEGGLLLRRTQETWTTVVSDGVAGNGNDLVGLGVTDDRSRLWLVGASGAVGVYDVTTGSLDDRSQPMDVSNNFNDVAVTGSAGAANVYIAGDSGQIYYSFDNGATGTWNAATPGSGSAVRAIDAFDRRAGHSVDGNTAVFQTQDGGTWNQTGIADADVGLRGIDSDATDRVWVAGGSGTVFRWNGSAWTPTRIGETALDDIEVENQSGRTVGDNGAIFAYDGSEWTVEDAPVAQNLNATVLSTPDTPAIAVGAGGTILER